MGSDVVLNWDEPVSEGLTGYNVYHAYETGDFDVLEFENNTTYTHVGPDLGLLQDINGRRYRSKTSSN